MGSRALVATAFAATALTAIPATAAASSPTTADAPRQRLIPYRAVEAQGIVAGHLLPRPGFGVDGAFVFGGETFQVRAGGLMVGMLPFELGRGEIGNVLAAGQLDVCVARNVVQHQIRMCVGGQGGGIAHQWKGYERPGRNATPWGAGTLKGDYRVALTKRFGIMGGVGVVVPFLGPTFRAYDEYGTPSPVVFPGPVGGILSLGGSFRW